MENDEALLAGLTIMEPLGDRKERDFNRFMADAGDEVINGIPSPRLQILTMDEILQGERFKTTGVIGRDQDKVSYL